MKVWLVLFVTFLSGGRKRMKKSLLMSLACAALLSFAAAPMLSAANAPGDDYVIKIGRAHV